MNIRVINRRRAPRINYVLVQPLPNGFYCRIDMRDASTPVWAGTAGDPVWDGIIEDPRRRLLLYPPVPGRTPPSSEISEVIFVPTPEDKCFKNLQIVCQSCSQNYDVVLFRAPGDGGFIIEPGSGLIEVPGPDEE